VRDVEAHLDLGDGERVCHGKGAHNILAAVARRGRLAQRHRRAGFIVVGKRIARQRRRINHHLRRLAVVCQITRFHRTRQAIIGEAAGEQQVMGAEHAIIQRGLRGRAKRNGRRCSVYR
jgi:hypothetical protein